MIRKSLINRSRVRWPDHTGRYPRLYNCNIFQGCGNDCLYCYARTLSGKTQEIWKQVDPVENAVELARKGIKQRPGRIMFCSMTDPYQRGHEELTRDVLEILLDSEHHVLICTKNALVVNDLPMIAQHENVEVGFTFTTLQTHEMEPHSDSPKERIRALTKAHNLGVKTFASVEPYIPGVTDAIQIIDELMAFVDRWIIGRLNHTGRLPAKSYFKIPDGFYKENIPRVIDHLDELALKYFVKEELMREVGS